MQIKPLKGRSVPDPVRGDLLPADGRNVEESTYWLRRIADGDVEKIVPSEKAAVAATKKKDGD